jgi:hypothetical protein
MRFQAVRAIARHRAQSAMLAGALLATTALLFLLTQVPS